MADKTPPSPGPPRLYQEIEGTAGFFPPEVYDLLTFQRASWQAKDDPLTPDFIPLSSVRKGNPRDTKLFVIGLLPPTANVTGNLLDRSATVAAVQGFAEAVDLDPGADLGGPLPGGVSVGPLVTYPGYQIPPASGPSTVDVPFKHGPTGPDKGGPVVTTHTPAEMYRIFHDAYVQAYNREPTPTELLFLVAQSMTETSGHWPNNNPGFLGNYKDPTVGTFYAGGFDAWGNANVQAGTSKKYFLTYQSPVHGARSMIGTVFSNPNARAAAASGDVIGYMTSLAQKGYFEESIEKYYGGGKEGGGAYPNNLKVAAAAIAAAGGPSWNVQGLPAHAPAGCAFQETTVEYRKRVGWSDAALSGKAPPPAFVSDQGLKYGTLKYASTTLRFTDTSFYNEACPKDGSVREDPNAKPPGWHEGGADAAAKAEKDAEKAADKNLNQSRLGQQLQGAQRDYIKALQLSLEQMRRTPPLRMLINPTSFKPSEEKIISDGNISRNGTIVQHWGEQQTKLTASGRIAGFYAIDAGANPNGSAGNGPGLTRMARNFSESYQNFLSLYLIYRNNGGIWLEDFDRRNPTANNLAMVGSVYIYYDNVLYIGSFDSLNVSESDDKPHSLDYDFSFTVRAQFDLDRIPDPIETYGNSALFAKAFPAQAAKSIPTSSTQETRAPLAAKTPEPTPTSVPEGGWQSFGGLTQSTDSLADRSAFGEAVLKSSFAGLPAPGANPALKK